MRQKIVAALAITLLSISCFWQIFLSDAGELENIIYTVSFVDAEDYNQKIFNSQSGTVREGEAVTVTFPEQILGNDGHLWHSALKSPQSFTIYGAGTTKFYVEYEQGEAVHKPEDPEQSQKKKLENWIKTAWKAECTITGENLDQESIPNLILTNKSENNRRIRNLVSMLTDAQWHYFYLIGKNYMPETLSMGTDMELLYSSFKEEDFFIGKDQYHVLKVGVRRSWNQENCIHDWSDMSVIQESCLMNGIKIFRCKKCTKEEKIVQLALGHKDENQDSLCDHCLKRSEEQKIGDTIKTTLEVNGNKKELSFTCLDEDYQGTGKMLYLSDEVLLQETTGDCFEENNDYNRSMVRQYLNLAFVNNSSVGTAFQPINRADGVGFTDYAALLSKEEYERYKSRGVLRETKNGYFLRTADYADNMKENILAVSDKGIVESIPVSDSHIYGVRPFVLLEKPETTDQIERLTWKKGDMQMRNVGGEIYRFICIDEDYSNSRNEYQSAALFLCDKVIRADIDSDSFNFSKLSFGENNNYKTSQVRSWLNANGSDTNIYMEPTYVGVSSAFTGSTKEESYGQLSVNDLIQHEIGFQLLYDQFFCLSVEEAVRYGDALWKFNGSYEDNPQSQVSPYSIGYYLRTPLYAEDEAGKFCYSREVYVVDLVNGSIHPAKSDSEVYGLRPAFTLPQEIK